MNICRLMVDSRRNDTKRRVPKFSKEEIREELLVISEYLNNRNNADETRLQHKELDNKPVIMNIIIHRDSRDLIQNVKVFE